MRHLLTIVLLICCSSPAAALELTAVSPSTVAPGTRVTLAGGPFGGGVTVVLGELRLEAADISERRLTFVVPSLPAGEYLLAVEGDGARSSGSFHLHVIDAPPRIVSLDPTILDNCGGYVKRQVTVSGSNFRPGAHLLFDNASLPLEKLDAGEIVFNVPLTRAGQHQVLVVNPDQQKSLSFSLTVNSAPEIVSIEFGADRTTEYELLINGKNFSYNTQLLLDGSAIGREGNAAASYQNRDTLRYVDCSTLVFVRRPVFREPRELTLQVVNPGGEQSNLYHITAP
jgi:hypothetical protein